MGDASSTVNLIVECLALMLDLVLIAGTFRDIVLKKRQLLLTAMFMHLVAMVGRIITLVYEGQPGPTVRMVLELSRMVASLFNIFTCVAIMVYIYSDAFGKPIRDPRASKITLALWILNGINAVLVLSNPITHVYYRYDEANIYVASKTGLLYSLFFLLQAVVMIPVVLRLRSRHGNPLTARLLFCGMLATLSIVTAVRYDLMSLIPFGVSLVLALLSVGVQMQLESDLVQARAELAESRMRLLSGQIHPHFIFNSLSAIKALVSEDPALAERTIQDFSDYLRSHLDEMSSARMVPFVEEMGHVRHYVSLEMADPSCPMEVTYDLEVEDFLVPPLTVQPLVENAIRHGIRTCENGGTVSVCTRRDNGAIKVIVRDDGSGMSSVTERQHHRRRVGIENVRERIERQCGGTLGVQIGSHGTTAIITLPESETA